MTKEELEKLRGFAKLVPVSEFVEYIVHGADMHEKRAVVETEQEKTAAKKAAEDAKKIKAEQKPSPSRDGEGDWASLEEQKEE